MKALILAGGFGKRLWPLTKNTPKALLPVKGTPLLEHLLKKLEPIEGIDRIFISVNARFEQQFADFLQHYQSGKFIKLVVEPCRTEEEKLGAVRGLAFAIEQETIQEPLLVLNGDNLLEDGLFGILQLYKQKKSPVVGLHDVGSRELATKYGIVELDKNNVITSFEEKPAEPAGTLASTGIYIFTSPAIQKIDAYLTANTGDRFGNFIAWLAKSEKVYGFRFGGRWLDIGSPEEYGRAQKDWDR